MSRPLFNEVVARPSARGLTRGRWSAWPVSLAAHTIAIGSLFLMPLVSSPDLPVVPSSLTAYVGQPEPPPPPPAPRVIAATIGTGGEVEDARVLRSVPLLDRAALDAVRQWRYTPTLLNGVPVRVIMTVTVHFSLKDEV